MSSITTPFIHCLIDAVLHPTPIGRSHSCLWLSLPRNHQQSTSRNVVNVASWLQRVTVETEMFSMGPRPAFIAATTKIMGDYGEPNPPRMLWAAVILALFALVFAERRRFSLEAGFQPKSTFKGKSAAGVQASRGRTPSFREPPGHTGSLRIARSHHCGYVLVFSFEQLSVEISANSMDQEAAVRIG